MIPKLYLSGGIEYAADPMTWRRKMFKALGENYWVVVPPIIQSPFPKHHEGYKGWILRNLILPDLRDIDTCDHFFLLLNHESGAGTTIELGMAFRWGKPIVVVFDDIKPEEIPAWTLGCLADATIVDDIDAAIEHYRRLI